MPKKDKNITYWEDVENFYSEEDDIYDTMFSQEQIDAWKKQWKK